MGSVSAVHRTRRNVGLVLVTGVPGVGKTTTLAGVPTKSPVIQFGDLILASAKSAGLRVDRDGLRRLPPERLAEFRRTAFDRLPARSIVDIHLTVETSSGFELAVPKEMLVPGVVRALIVLEDDARRILDKRKSRRHREDSLDLKGIGLHQERNRELAQELQTRTGCALFVIPPHHDAITEALTAVDMIS